ncbi:MAG: PH domain-containing protein [Deltaproteobacteria bacterium]|nr:PH domain-containing protein [Deltaproteobacteria bacterium]
MAIERRPRGTAATAPATPTAPTDLDGVVKAIERPHPNLLWLYVITALLTVVGAPVVLVPLYFRYHTLRYRFDDEGLHASWGILFRREVSLTYARIQDIHLRRNVIERWLGLGSVQIQTASGSGSAELVVEGVTQFVEVRDFLYAKMRGAHHKPQSAARVVDDQAVALLREIKDELRMTRERLAARAGGGDAA